MSLTTLPAQVARWIEDEGNWNDPGNWSQNAVPQSSGEAVINNGGTIHITDPVSASYKVLFIGESYTLPSSGSIVMSGGTLSGETSYLGFSSTSNASVTITGGVWDTSSTLFVGYNGHANLLVDGGVVNSSYITIKAFEEASTSSVTVASGTLQAAEYLDVGNSGTGGHLLINGGFVSSGTGRIGVNGNSSGSVTVTGGSWNTTALYVGLSAMGSVDITDGGVITNEDGFVGYHSGAKGTVLVSGQASMWESTDNLTVGFAGTNNTLTVEQGGLVKVGDAIGETIVFSILSGPYPGNFLRIDDGYVALFGDQMDYVSDLIADGNIQLWSGSAWVTSTEESDFEFLYFSTNEAAEAFSGYQGLGGYTILTSAIPEPGAATLIVLGLGALALRRRRKTVSILP